MPTYCYDCKKCGNAEERVLPMSQSGELQTCPKCHYLMDRDISAEGNHAVRFAEAPEQFSEAAGVHPSQIAECVARFPHHEFTPDGRMVFHGQRHKDRCLRDIGFVEHDRR